MKRCRNITCWTDYPFEELGDVAYQEAPVRRVRVVRYDGDKYAYVVVDGQELSLKCGYLYQKPGRYGQVKTVDRRKLERMIPAQPA